MYKEQFLNELRRGLSGLPQDDIDERISFYSEMIDDRIEDGMPEEEAVAQIGPVNDIVQQVTADIPLSKLVREKVKPKRSLKVWEIILIVIGSPIWVSLLIAAFAVMFSLYAALWVVVISIYAVNLALAAEAVCCLPAAVVYLIKGNPAGAGFAVGAGLVCAGLAILLFFACIKITKGVLKLTKKMLMKIKTLFIRKKA